MICINCGHEVNSEYCANCGQKNPPKKITLAGLWSDFFARIYGFDGMFPRTLRDLTLRPGFVTQEYLKGNRVKYYGPVGYFFLMITLYFLIMPLLGFSMDDLVTSAKITSQVKPGSNQAKFVQDYVGFITDNIRLFLFFMVVTISLSSYLVFKKSKLNLLESSVLPFFAYGHVYWLSILLLVIKNIFHLPLKDAGVPLVQVAFFAFGCTGLYTYQSKVKVFLKGVLAYFLGFILLIVCMLVTAAVYLLILRGEA